MKTSGLVLTILLVLSFVALIVASTSVVFAKRQTYDIEFDSHWDDNPQESKFVGNMWFIYRDRQGEFTGDIEGTWTSHTTLVSRWNGVNYVTIKVSGVYEVTVNSLRGDPVSGTFVMRTESLPLQGVESRKWTIMQGTDDLAGIHGSGTYNRGQFDGSYFGTISLNQK